MQIKLWVIIFLIFSNLKLNSHIDQIDVLNKEDSEVFLFSDIHINDAILEDPKLLKELYPDSEESDYLVSGLYKGINLQQALCCINNIKRNYNPKDYIITVEDNREDISILYPTIIDCDKNYFNNEVVIMGYINYLAKFEKLPLIRNIEFREFIDDWQYLSKLVISHKERLISIKSNISKIANILRNILNELLHSPDMLIRNTVINQILPKLNTLILSKERLFNNNSLLFLLQNIDLNELWSIAANLIDLRALNIILSNESKIHFLFLGGSHSRVIKKYLIEHYNYKFNKEKSYQEFNNNPINMHKYFSNIFNKTQLISKL